MALRSKVRQQSTPEPSARQSNPGLIINFTISKMGQWGQLNPGSWVTTGPAHTLSVYTSPRVLDRNEPVEPLRWHCSPPVTDGTLFLLSPSAIEWHRVSSSVGDTSDTRRPETTRPDRVVEAGRRRDEISGGSFSDRHAEPGRFGDRAWGLMMARSHLHPIRTAILLILTITSNLLARRRCSCAAQQRARDASDVHVSQIPGTMFKSFVMQMAVRRARYEYPCHQLKCKPCRLFSDLLSCEANKLVRRSQNCRDDASDRGGMQ